jgi:putative glutamine amidotransferase
MKPLIGITPSPSMDEMGHGAFYRYCLSRTYIDSIRAAGGIPIILPTDAVELDDLFPRLDGLLVSGGGDLDPALYGDHDVHETTYGIDAERDDFETVSYRYAVEHDVPTLCICRGIQVMAVAQGGTLVQDIPTQVVLPIEHRQHNLGKMRDEVSHPVSIADGNPLREIIGADSIEVNSFHHQAVKDPGKDLVIIATAGDGVIEALWNPGMRFNLGVQWHPEMLSYTFPKHAAIFSAFVHAAGLVPAPA